MRELSRLAYHAVIFSASFTLSMIFGKFTVW